MTSYLIRRLGIDDKGCYKISSEYGDEPYFENLAFRTVIDLCSSYFVAFSTAQVIKDYPDGYENGNVTRTASDFALWALDDICTRDIQNVASLVSFTFDDGSFHTDIIELVISLEALTDTLEGFLVR